MSHDTHEAHEKQEALADIVAEMRERTDLDGRDMVDDFSLDAAYGEYGGYDALMLIKAYADRIEAAWKRERAEIEANALAVGGVVEAATSRKRATADKSSAVGDAAAMREALEKAKKAICHYAEYVCQSLSWENSDIQSNCGDVLCAHRDLCLAKTAINAALALPRRQCDVGTAGEQAKRLNEWCNGRHCINCQFKGGWPDQCKLQWAQMPYTEGGAK